MIKFAPEIKKHLKRFCIPALIILVSSALAVDVYLSIKYIGKEPLCHRESCIDLDPRKPRNCDTDVRTIVEEKINQITIQLRYSAKCDAAWSKAVVPNGSILYVEDTQGKQYGRWLVPPDYEVKTAYFGNMGPGRKLKACVQLPDNKHLCTKLAEQK